MKQNDIWKGKLGDQSEFSFQFACWANNHRGKSKAKKNKQTLSQTEIESRVAETDR